MVIDRYIIKQISQPMVMGVGLLVIIFFGFSASKELALAAEKSIDLTTALKLISLNTMTTLDVLLPSALFFSILAGLGRLYKEAEIQVLLATGVSPWRILWAVFKLALLIAVLVSLLAVKVRPWLYDEIYRLESAAEMKLDVRQMPTGGFVHLEDLDYLFIADGLDETDLSYTDVFLYRQHNQGENSEIIHAKSAKLPSLKPGDPRELIFHSPYHYLFDLNGTRDATEKTMKFSVLLPDVDARKEKFRRKAAPIQQLKTSDSLKDQAEYQWRLSAPLVPLLLALIAVPLSRVWPRESRSRNVVYALLIYIVVFSFTTAVRSWFEQGIIPPIPGLWSAYLLPLAILAVLLMSNRWRTQ